MTKSVNLIKPNHELDPSNLYKNRSTNKNITANTSASKVLKKFQEDDNLSALSGDDEWNEIEKSTLQKIQQSLFLLYDTLDIMVPETKVVYNLIQNLREHTNSMSSLDIHCFLQDNPDMNSDLNLWNKWASQTTKETNMSKEKPEWYRHFFESDSKLNKSLPGLASISLLI